MFSAETSDRADGVLTAIHGVLERHWYILGAEVERFERHFAAYCGTDHCVGVANGTDALEIALRALGVEPGDRVALVANAGFYGSTAVMAIGAIPRYVDVDGATRTMSPDGCREAVAEGVKAVIVTHLYGQLADIETLTEIAVGARVPVIEDCAQSHGAARGRRRAGAFGTVGCFSFYPTKNLGGIGDGGALVTRDAQLAARIRQLRGYGWGRKYHVELAGGRNSRLDELQAAVLDVKLPHLDAWNAERRAIAGRYVDAFEGLPITSPGSLGEDYVAHLFVIEVDERDALRAALASAGVATDVHYPVPDHLQPVLGGLPPPSLPVTEASSARVVTLPCFPGLTEEQQQRVIVAVRRAHGRG